MMGVRVLCCLVHSDVRDRVEALAPAEFDLVRATPSDSGAIGGLTHDDSTPIVDACVIDDQGAHRYEGTIRTLQSRGVPTLLVTDHGARALDVVDRIDDVIERPLDPLRFRARLYGLVSEHAFARSGRGDDDPDDSSCIYGTRGSDPPSANRSTDTGTSRSFITETFSAETFFATTHVPACVVEFVDLDPRVRAVNDAFERTILSGEYLVGRSLIETIVPSDRRVEAARVVARALGGSSSQLVTRRDTIRGRRDVRLRTTPISDGDDVVGMTVTYEDVTEKRCREQQVAVLDRILRHNLRNDLNVIRGYTAEIPSEDRRIETEEAIETIRDTCDKLITLSQTARNLRRSIRPIDPESCIDVARVAASLQTEFTNRYPSGTFDIEVPERQVALADERLRAGLSEICENAFEHADRDDPTVHLAVRRTGGHVVITLTDDGPGMPETERMVFEDGFETALDHGSGIGLWIARWMIRSIGGDISVSDRTDGTEITIRLSVAPSIEGFEPSVQPSG